MALYKHEAVVGKSTSDAFDEKHNPGAAAPYAGIYRCVKCTHEIGIAEGHILPAQNHNQHRQALVRSSGASLSTLSITIKTASLQ